MIKAIDFFCGAGGLTRGLLDAGVKVLAGVDTDEALQDTYEKNNHPSRFICEDVSAIDVEVLRRKLNIDARDRTLYAACTPCQPFSTLNQRHGDDDRKSLLLAFGRLVEAAPPDYIVVENVPGLNTAYGRDIYQQFEQILERTGFRNRTAEMLDAKDFGVPQVRRRFILLASRRGPVPRPRRSRIIPTVRDQIAEYPPIAAGDEYPQLHNHVARPLQPHHVRIVEAVPKDGGSRQEIQDTSILLKCHRDRPKVHKDVFGRMAWDAPAPTLTCRCTDVYCGRFVHPEQHRGISLREAAALQTFADSYLFYGTSTLHIARQIGNAVPVEFARRLGNAILCADRHAGKKP